MKRLAILMSVLMTLMVVGVAPATAATLPEADWDVKVEWPGSEANKSSYWVKYFKNENPRRTNVTCTKYENHNGNLPGQYEAGVIKAGQWDYIYYQPDNVARYLGGDRQDLSHIFKCNWDLEDLSEPAEQSATMRCISETQVQITYKYDTGLNANGEPATRLWERQITGKPNKDAIELTGSGTRGPWVVGLGKDMQGQVSYSFRLGNDYISDSRFFVCGEPRGPEAEFFGKAYGPKGDPWYRFTFWNYGETSGTCFVKVDGDIIFKKRIPVGEGFKTGWRFIPGYSKVKMACWSGGEKVWGKSFRAAAPGYYGPLWKGYDKGYFQI